MQINDKFIKCDGEKEGRHGDGDINEENRAQRCRNGHSQTKFQKLKYVVHEHH